MTDKITEEKIEEMKNEVYNLHNEFIEKLKELFGVIPDKPGRLLRTWLWFQKHAFTTLILIFFGIMIGVGIQKVIHYNEMVAAINLQRFEFKGDLFEIQPSSIKKYYTHDKKEITSIIPKLEPKVIEPVTPPVQNSDKKEGKFNNVNK